MTQYRNLVIYHYNDFKILKVKIILKQSNSKYIEPLKFSIKKELYHIVGRARYYFLQWLSLCLYGTCHQLKHIFKQVGELWLGFAILLYPPLKHMLSHYFNMVMSLVNFLSSQQNLYLPASMILLSDFKRKDDESNKGYFSSKVYIRDRGPLHPTTLSLTVTPL
ncbi:hypothetical protein FF38_06486 [Lucilia cuprina]|uniref:Uncharacterized protein n=1 Tax=Lucilia cuprina TaxID=7375 RepID=A0A0L0BPP2_LUCCU|nr:hypothetical protein FF38_06486 [Lucilia cuprina]